MSAPPTAPASLMDRVIRFALDQKLVVLLVLAGIVGWGVIVAPFDWDLSRLPWGLAKLHRDPVPVDAIPDLGENQQIVFTAWPGRSPQDVEDQITYPLTTQLMGIPRVRTVRSYSMFGFSTIYVIFEEGAEFYWSRSRVLEKLGSLPSDILPPGVKASLGPDATALGQVFWYTLEGRDPKGRPAGGWDLQELRALQDFFVRYGLLTADGVAEVASIGGFVKEYQVDVDPEALSAHRVKLHEVVAAVRLANRDVGARTIEVNSVEYVVRGVGFIRSVSDIEHAVIRVEKNVPIYVKDVARVALGPATRRGALDKAGAEAVGGVVVARYGSNPLAVIKDVKAKISQIEAGLPERTLADGTRSKVTIVPFYDRSQLIQETLETLSAALTQEIMITVIVVLLMVWHLQSSALISGLLPVAVLMTFITMRLSGVDANVVALSGIAIAIGTMVDMGIVITENILRHLELAPPEADRKEVIFRASSEVAGAVLTAVSTTVISFLPVFTMEAAEGKLFKPLAFTKTFALLASVVVAIVLIPPLAHLTFGGRIRGARLRLVLEIGLVVLGAVAGVALSSWWIGVILASIGVWLFVKPRISGRLVPWIIRGFTVAAAGAVVVLLASDWLPLGPERGLGRNLLVVGLLVGGLLGFFYVFQILYPRLLAWCLEHKLLFLSLPAIIVITGATIWLGFDRVFGWLPASVRSFGPVAAQARAFPGLGKEFMPDLDEGSYLLMPTTMPHASIGEVMDLMRKQDIAIAAIPEVESAVGKLGRADSALDPAPISMIETVILYHPEYLQDRVGRRRTFRVDPDATDWFRDEAGKKIPAADGRPYKVRGRFSRSAGGHLVPDPAGRPFRRWRPALEPALNPGRAAWKGIRKRTDIWDEITRLARVPGITSAPRLQPIAARIVMLQSGMRAPMGLKIKGPKLEIIERVAVDVERALRRVPSIDPATVSADRIVGKPYLEIRIDRQAIARYGIQLEMVQQVIEAAVGGMAVTTTVEGRERYPVRVRYPRERRDSPEALEGILVAAPGAAQVPLGQLAEIRYVRGPDMIKAEDTFLVAYVTFDKRGDRAEVDVVEEARAFLKARIAAGELKIPHGVTWEFAGSFENQVRSERKLLVVLPLALGLIFLILYFQFRSTWISALVFSGVAVAWAGGFLMIWFYHQSWFLDFHVFGVHMRELFDVKPIHLSVAVWVGFLALFGIATDDGVLIGTYLRDRFRATSPRSISEIRAMTIDGGTARVRPAVMTTATTLLALLPVLTSQGRGSDIMVPMAIPSFGGMLIEVLTMLVVPVLFSAVKELHFRLRLGQFAPPEVPSPAPIDATNTNGATASCSPGPAQAG